MDAREDAVEDVALQVCLACHDDGCIVGEERDDVVGGVLCEDGDCDTEADGHRECIAQGLLCAAEFARADVLRAERRDSRQHGRRREEQEADDFFHDADGRRVREAAHIRDDRDDEEGNLDEAVLQRDRHADTQDVTEHRAVGREVMARDCDARAAMTDVPKRDDDADALRDDGRDGRALWPHAEEAQERVIEHDVQHAGDGDEIHRAARVTEPAEDGRDDVICRDERDAERTIIQVVIRADDSFFRRRHDGDDVRQEHHHDRRERDRHAEEQRDRVADGTRRRLHVAPADSTRDRDRRPHGEADDDDGHHVHDLTADGHSRDARRALELADDEEIGHAVERLQEIREEVWQREIHDVLRDAAGCHVLGQKNTPLTP